MEILFQKLGMNQNEQEVYLTVLKAGKIAPQQVARLTRINRTTVYSIAKKLESLGLIVQDYGQRVRYLVAEDPHNVLVMLGQEEKKIQEKKKVAEELVKELVTMKSEKHYSVPRIRFVEEDDLEKFLYDSYGRWSESVAKDDNVWRGFQDNSFTERYEEWIEWTWNQDKGKSLKVEFFMNDSHVEKKLLQKHPTRHMKVLPKSVSFDSCLWVTGEYIIMTQTRVRPHYLVEIYDVVLARNQRELFKGLWEMAKEVK